MKLGIIGGSGLNDLDGMTDVQAQNITTPCGNPSSELLTGKFDGSELVFLSRHGKGHFLLPNEINYKANIAAMKMLGVTHILSISAVGSLRRRICPRDVVVADQFFDNSRMPPDKQTFFGNGIAGHVSFAEPVCPELSALAADVLERAIHLSSDRSRKVFRGGTYVNMAGPAFSTRAESRFYRTMGFHVIGMTNATEAKLAREAEICYATAAFVTDFDCWHRSREAVTVEMILSNMAANTELARALVSGVAKHFAELERTCSCSHALENVIATAPEAIPEDVRRNHALIFGKYLKSC